MRMEHFLMIKLHITFFFILYNIRRNEECLQVNRPRKADEVPHHSFPLIVRHEKRETVQIIRTQTQKLPKKSEPCGVGTQNH